MSASTAGVSARTRASDAGSSLFRLPPGHAASVVHVDQSVEADLAREGLIVGAEVTVLSRGPLGGPVIVRLGRTRLALSADIARRIVVEERAAGERAVGIVPVAGCPDTPDGRRTQS